jgi:hypothetical protein
MATKTFEDYFASKGVLPGEELIDGDEALVLRSSTVFRGSPDINNALANMEGNALVTTINTVDVWEQISGVMADAGSTTTFTFAANQYTYIGVNQLGADTIRASVSLLSAADAQYQVGVFVNSVLVGLGMTTSATTLNAAFVSSAAPYALQAGDVIDLRIRNITDAENVTVLDAQLEIS